jgi:hypothetical protein
MSTGSKTAFRQWRLLETGNGGELRLVQTGDGDFEAQRRGSCNVYVCHKSWRITSLSMRRIGVKFLPAEALSVVILYA